MKYGPDCVLGAMNIKTFKNKPQSSITWSLLSTEMRQKVNVGVMVNGTVNNSEKSKAIKGIETSQEEDFNFK